MNYKTITAAEQQQNLAEAFVSREHELYAYDLNIANYTAMLAELPQGEWPEHLAQYKGRPLEQVPEEHDEAVSQLNYRDRLRMLLRTEKAERAKSNLCYSTILNQLPAEKTALETLLNEAKTKLNI